MTAGGPLSFKHVEVSLRKPNVFALQILQHYLTKENRVRKFSHCLYGRKNLVFENLKGSHVRNFLGFPKLKCFDTSKCLKLNRPRLRSLSIVLEHGFSIAWSIEL